MRKKEFWELVDISEGCWNWKGGKNGKGRALFDGRSAPRKAWTLIRGDIPAGLNVLHHCDNPACVNPDHLFLGTQKDNVYDMIAKGRDRKRGLRGEESPNSKLTWHEVDCIRQMSCRGVTGKQLAEMFHVGKMQVSRIINGKAWNVKQPQA